MAKLAKTPKELIEEHELSVKAQKNPSYPNQVYLIGRELKNGSVSLFRYTVVDGKRYRTNLKAIIRPELDMTIRQANKEIVRTEKEALDKLNRNLANEERAYNPSLDEHEQKNYKDLLLLDFAKDVISERKKQSTISKYSTLLRHIEIFDAKVKLVDVNKIWVLGFIDYLRNKAVCCNQLKPKPLSANTQSGLVTMLAIIMNSARKREFIEFNPFELIESKDRIKGKAHTRNYLDAKELQKLIDTPVKPKHQIIKDAFLFATMCGLRLSDIRNITPKLRKVDEVGEYLDVKMVKTGKQIRVYLTKQALKYLPDVAENEHYFVLPTATTIEKFLDRWVKSAGIDKKITFHCSRHTIATLMLSKEKSIASVSKVLGHENIRTTQIYADLVSEEQMDAVSVMDDLFG